MEVSSAGAPVLCIDLGKTSARFAVLDSDREGRPHVTGGHPGAARDETGSSLLAHLADQVASLALPQYDSVGVGAAGTLTAPAAARRIAVGLRTALGRPVAVTSDIITAHAGALGGDPGVVLITGTGAVGLGLGEDGRLTRVDGWGPDIGDLGGGSWIGREAVRAVLTAAAVGANATTLTERLRPATGAVSDLVAAVAASGNPGQLLASFAPAVLEEAHAGDSVARTIVARAVEHLAETAHGAARHAPARAALLGGLVADSHFRSALERALRNRDLTPVPARGSALAGARLLALRSDLPFEEYIHRA